MFDDLNLKTFVNQGMPLEYVEINAEQISASCLGNIVKLCNVQPDVQQRPIHDRGRTGSSPSEASSPITYLGVTKSDFTSLKRPKAHKDKLVRSLMLHNAAMDCSVLKVLGESLKNTRELTMSSLSQVDRSAKLALLFTPASALATNLRKLELSCSTGFSDKDLASAIKNCTQIQWLELSFAFSFIKTLSAICDCRKLLYAKLHKFAIPEEVPMTVVDGITVLDIPSDRRARFLASSKECRYKKSAFMV